MTFSINSAVVVDDSLGPPVVGSIEGEDKNIWFDFILENEAAQKSLFLIFLELSCSSVDELLEKITSDHNNIVSLWKLHVAGSAEDCGLEKLFKTEKLTRVGKTEKAELVTQVLKGLIKDPENVRQFHDLVSANDSLVAADIAFVDFYLSDDESEEQAIHRITLHASSLASAKLVFFMSSRASLATQQRVREIIGVRTAFFEVMHKNDICDDFIKSRIDQKVSSYDSNQALQGIINGLMTAAVDAMAEFKKDSMSLEVHDLQLLEVFRLSAEGQSLTEYLTWLFSETLAAKTRRIGYPAVVQAEIKPDNVRFTGEILQKQVLFDFFSEIVFTSRVSFEGGIRFGELVQEVNPENNGKYFLVLTPACDLVRCDADKNILCVAAEVSDYTSPLEQSKEKLFGKHGSALRHLYKVKGDVGGKALLFTWQKDFIRTFKISELQSVGFKPVALMNELFAHEVKEEVLRELGRVGTSINPAPPFALNASVRWQCSGVTHAHNTPDGDFISALLSYSEKSNGTSRKACPVVVFSERFKNWVLKTISAIPEVKVDAKLQACICALSKEFQINEKWQCKDNELLIAIAPVVSEEPLGRVLLEVTLLLEV
ncbi:hypothetical protein ACQJ22_12050 [Pseudomonas fragariae (ex Marin et al. 2024)]|uniref:hypothetical protein n=1 Tax=Pseudomonas fragariae (ex Marin et al. 2024) TaxID=3080056 RepID=UPI003D091222